MGKTAWAQEAIWDPGAFAQRRLDQADERLSTNVRCTSTPAVCSAANSRHSQAASQALPRSLASAPAEENDDDCGPTQDILFAALNSRQRRKVSGHA
jgi:hypothetical protein